MTPMVALFCLRLACGMTAALLCLTPAQVNPRFFRVQFQVALGLAAAAGVFLAQSADAGVAPWAALGAGAFFCFLGSVVWSLEGAPAGRVVTVLAALALAAALGLTAPAVLPDWAPAPLLAAEFSSALLLGAATTAMLMGHSYLIAPAMSITPLLRLLALFFGAVLVRMGVAGVGLLSWTGGHSLATLNEVTLLLSVRWLLGFVVPLVLGGMAWQAARIRSTQSATGILYAVVFACLVGELTGQLLLSTTRLPL